MKRLIFLLLFPLIACSGTDTPFPSTPTTNPVPPTSISPTTIPNTSSPTEPAATATPPGATTFPDPSGYQWQMISAALTRPVDLQPDGSGRLFIIEKIGRIRMLQDGQLLEQSFLDITDRVGSKSNEQGLLG